MKNLKLFEELLLANVKFFFLNLLKCNSVQERVIKFPFSPIFTVSFQNILKETIHIEQKYLIKQFEIFTNECTHILRTSNFWKQGFQISAL